MKSARALRGQTRRLSSLRLARSLVDWTLEENATNLVGQRVQILSGDRVGTVEDSPRRKMAV